MVQLYVCVLGIFFTLITYQLVLCHHCDNYHTSNNQYPAKENPYIYGQKFAAD